MLRPYVREELPVSHPVADALTERWSAGSRPGSRSDSYRIGLAIEGGAMRGVVSAGMLVALEQLGLLAAFDAVYGASAGGVNGAYFVAGQAAFGTTIYYESINNRSFSSFGRLFTRRPVIDIDFLIREVVVRRKPLDTAAVLSSPVPLTILGTNADTGDRDLFGRCANERELLDALRATTSVPVIGGPAFPFRGNRYFDGGIRESVPTRVAAEDGCTHVLALCTRPPGPFRTTSRRVLEHLLIERTLSRQHPTLFQFYRERPVAYQRLLEEIARQSDSKQTDPAVLMIRPASGRMVGGLERSRDRLVRAAAEGMRAVFEAFGVEFSWGLETLGAFDRHGQRASLRGSLSQGGVQ